MGGVQNKFVKVKVIHFNQSNVWFQNTIRVDNKISTYGHVEFIHVDSVDYRCFKLTTVILKFFFSSKT